MKNYPMKLVSLARMLAAANLRAPAQWTAILRIRPASAVSEVPAVLAVYDADVHRPMTECRRRDLDIAYRMALTEMLTDAGSTRRAHRTEGSCIITHDSSMIFLISRIDLVPFRRRRTYVRSNSALVIRHFEAVPSISQCSKPFLTQAVLVALTKMLPLHLITNLRAELAHVRKRTLHHPYGTRKLMSSPIRKWDQFEHRLGRNAITSRLVEKDLKARHGIEVQFFRSSRKGKPRLNMRSSIADCFDTPGKLRSNKLGDVQGLSTTLNFLTHGEPYRSEKCKKSAQCACPSSGVTWFFERKKQQHYCYRYRTQRDGRQSFNNAKLCPVHAPSFLEGILA